MYVREMYAYDMLTLSSISFFSPNLIYKLKELLHSLGLEMVDETNMDKWIEDIDEDGSGGIDCGEFLSIFNGLNQKNVMNLDQMLLETFQLVSDNRCWCIPCLVANSLV
jgi:hypothetical protein